MQCGYISAPILSLAFRFLSSHREDTDAGNVGSSTPEPASLCRYKGDPSRTSKDRRTVSGLGPAVPPGFNGICKRTVTLFGGQQKDLKTTPLAPWLSYFQVLSSCNSHLSGSSRIDP